MNSYLLSMPNLFNPILILSPKYFSLSIYDSYSTLFYTFDIFSQFLRQNIKNSPKK